MVWNSWSLVINPTSFLSQISCPTYLMAVRSWMVLGKIWFWAMSLASPRFCSPSVARVEQIGWSLHTPWGLKVKKYLNYTNLHDGCRFFLSWYPIIVDSIWLNNIKYTFFSQWSPYTLSAENRRIFPLLLLVRAKLDTKDIWSDPSGMTNRYLLNSEQEPFNSNNFQWDNKGRFLRSFTLHFQFFVNEITTVWAKSPFFAGKKPHFFSPIFA